MEVPGFPDDLAQCTGFQWDAGNADKNRDLHQVSQGECEQVFFNRPLLVAPDIEHSQREPRYAALGQTNAARRLAVVFTIRETLIRVISARDMSRRERRARTTAVRMQSLPLNGVVVALQLIAGRMNRGIASLTWTSCSTKPRTCSERSTRATPRDSRNGDTPHRSLEGCCRYPACPSVVRAE